MRHFYSSLSKEVVQDPQHVTTMPDKLPEHTVAHKLATMDTAKVNKPTSFITSKGTSVLDAQTQNGDEPVGEYSFSGQSCLSSADS